MKVICASYPRTGTKSFAAALRMMGYTVYDYEESFFVHGRQWLQIYNNGSDKELFKEMYKNVDAVTDSPVYYYWKEILEAFPEAKIVFIERDADSWVRSWRSMLNEWTKRPLWLQLSAYLSPTSMMFRDLVDHTGSIVTGRTPFQHNRPWMNRVKLNEEIAKRKYEDHYYRVKREAPKGRVLWYQITDGWKPLCDFLDEPVPTEPFPWLNKGGTVVQKIRNNALNDTIVKESLINLSIIVLFISMGVFLFFTYFCQIFCSFC